MQQTGAGSLNFFNWENSHIPEILHEIYIQKIYHQYITNKKDAVFFDLGANIALWSLYAAPYAKHVYAFEPTLETYKLGKMNLENNGVKNVTLVQKAVAPEDGETFFYHCTNSTMNSLKPDVNDKQTKETVTTVRLDTFVKENKIDHIDFAKIDIEGSEPELFTSESFKNIVPILDAFVYEWHQWGSSNPLLLNAGLMGYGYKINQIKSNAVLFICQK